MVSRVGENTLSGKSAIEAVASPVLVGGQAAVEIEEGHLGIGGKGYRKPRLIDQCPEPGRQLLADVAQACPVRACSV